MFLLCIFLWNRSGSGCKSLKPRNGKSDPYVTVKLGLCVKRTVWNSGCCRPGKIALKTVSST